jgi:P4 family phage/plasmid primase-like protien
LEEEWNPHCRPPWLHEELADKVANAARYKQNEGAANAVQSSEEVFKGFATNEPVASKEEKQYFPKPLSTGDDVDIATAMLAELQHKLGQVIHAEGAFYYYNGKHWAELEPHKLKAAAQRFSGQQFGDKGIVKLTQGRITSILSLMSVQCAEPKFFTKPAIGINCANGFIEFDEGGNPKLIKHDRQQRARHVIDAAWEPDVDWRWEAPLLGQLLDGCFLDDPDKESRINLIGEICGCAALGHATRLTQPKAIVLHGPHANNGKSELLVLARGVLPADAISAVPPSKLDHDPMYVELRGKTLNAVDELGTSGAITSDIFKGTITGNQRAARQIYKEAETIIPTALHLFATNMLPPFKGGFDSGVQRRLIVLPLARVIPERDRVAAIGTKVVHSEGAALLAFTVEGASRLLRQGAFTEPPSCHGALREWVLQSDPVHAWHADRTVSDPDARTPQREAYNDFQAWCHEEGRKSDIGTNVFVQRLLSHDHRIGSGARNNKIGRTLLGFRLLPLGERGV